MNTPRNKLSKEAKDILIEFIIQAKNHYNISRVLEGMDIQDEAFDAAVKELEELQVQEVQAVQGTLADLYRHLKQCEICGYRYDPANEKTECPHIDKYPKHVENAVKRKR